VEPSAQLKAVHIVNDPGLALKRESRHPHAHRIRTADSGLLSGKWKNAVPGSVTAQ
jgi:hypothetical protein